MNRPLLHRLGSLLGTVPLLIVVLGVAQNARPPAPAPLAAEERGEAFLTPAADTDSLRAAASRKVYAAWQRARRDGPRRHDYVLLLARFYRWDYLSVTPAGRARAHLPPPGD